MAGEFKTLNFSEGVETTAPSELPLGSIDNHSDVDTTTDAPTTGDVLTWDGTNWVPDVGGAGSGEVNFNTNPNAVAGIDLGDANDIGDYVAVEGDAGGATGVIPSQATTGLPRAPYQTTGVLLTFAAGTADYTRLRFRVPPADRGKKLKIEWAQLPASYVAGTAKVEVYSFADAYGFEGDEVALHGDDSSGDSYLPNATGVYYNEFDADSREYYELRIVNAGATAGTITINDFVIGPGKLHSGAVVTPWKDFTPSWTNLTASNTYARYRRVGDSMELMIRQQAATSSGTVSLALPESLTIAGSTPSVPLGYLKIDDTLGNFTAYRNGSTGGSINFYGASATLGSGTYPLSSDIVGIRLWVPISEWAGSGVLNVITQDNLSETSGTETPTLNSATSVSASTITWRKVGDKMRADFYLVYSAAGDNSDLTITIPNNKTIDTTKLTNSSIGVANLGSFRWTTSSAVKTGFISFESTTKVNFFESGVASNRVESDQFAASDSLSGWFEVPISEFAGSQSSLVGFSAASATQSGLVDTGAQTFAGAKTFNDGISFGDETLSTYNEGTITVPTASVTVTNCTLTTDVTISYTVIGKTVFLNFGVPLATSSGVWTVSIPTTSLTDVVGALRTGFYQTGSSTLIRGGNQTGYAGHVYHGATAIILRMTEAYVGTGSWYTSASWLLD